MVAKIRRPMVRKAALAISILLVLLLTYSLVPKPAPPTSAIIGTWVHAGPKEARTTLTFKQDGSFVIEDIPKQVFARYGTPSWDQPLDWTTPISLTGTWEITGHREAGNPTVTIDILADQNQAGFITFLEVEGLTPWLSISNLFGSADSDNRFDFTKK